MPVLDELDKILMDQDDEDDDWSESERSQWWECEECGYKDYDKPMPSDRVAFYLKVEKTGGPKCPKCRSAGYHPVGF